jgi:[acyl-carrier-protein] S-malonyltransferase
MELVTVRGREMAAAAAGAEPTSMAAVLGGEELDVLERLAQCGLTPANMNGGGQIVAAGSAAGVAALIAEPPARARVIELQVAGAFHTAYMEPAVAALAQAAAALSPATPLVPLLSNADGAVVTNGPDALERIVRQVANPVRWDLCQARMLDLGVTGIIEVAPGGVLTGLAKRSLKGVPAVALTSPADLPAARELLEQHA